MSITRVPDCADHGHLRTDCWVGECSRCGRPVHLSVGHPRPLDPCSRCTPIVQQAASPAAMPVMFPSAGRARRYLAQPVGKADLLRAAFWISVAAGFIAWRERG